MALNSALAFPSITAYPDFTLRLYLDVSNEGLGAILVQVQSGREHIFAVLPILSPLQKRIIVLKRGMSCCCLGCFLLPPFPSTYSTFTVYTNHRSLQWLRSLQHEKFHRCSGFADLEKFLFTISRCPSKLQTHVVISFLYLPRAATTDISTLASQVKHNSSPMPNLKVNNAAFNVHRKLALESVAAKHAMEIVMPLCNSWVLGFYLRKVLIFFFFFKSM